MVPFADTVSRRMRFPVRRILLGFVVGAGAGWVASLLRRPADAPPGTGADAAEHMPQEEFGDLPAGEPPGEPALEGAGEIAQEPTAPVGDPPEAHEPPRKAVPPMVTPPPGREDPPAPGAATAEPAKPTKRARKKADSVALVAEPVSEAVREGREAMNEALDGLDTTPPEAPVTRRRRRT